MQAFYFLYLKNKEYARVKPSDGKLGIYRQPINTHYYSCCWGQKLYNLEVFFSTLMLPELLILPKIFNNFFA